MHKLYNWMPYGEIECSNLARGVSWANLVALCTNSYADWRIRLHTMVNYECRMASLVAHYGEFVCRLANVVALKRL